MQTITPEVNVYIDLLYTMLNITTLTGAQWYLGLPFGYPVNVSGIVEMVKIYEEVLGDNLIALQLGKCLICTPLRLCEAHEYRYSDFLKAMNPTYMDSKIVGDRLHTLFQSI